MLILFCILSGYFDFCDCLKTLQILGISLTLCSIKRGGREKEKGRNE
jgi:hypothetical protein